jgi:hypothetical protein
MNKLLLITAGIVLLAQKFQNRLRVFNPIRGKDVHGSGHFGASRGNRPHLGIDIITQDGAGIYAPFEMYVDRKSNPYFDDTHLTGIKFTTALDNITYDGRMWYFSPDSNIVGRFVDKGEFIGIAQDLVKKYDGITNHIHFQLRTRDSVPQEIEQIDYNGWTYINPSYYV